MFVLAEGNLQTNYTRRFEWMPSLALNEQGMFYVRETSIKAHMQELLFLSELNVNKTVLHFPRIYVIWVIWD